MELALADLRVDAVFDEPLQLLLGYAGIAGAVLREEFPRERSGATPQIPLSRCAHTGKNLRDGIAIENLKRKRGAERRGVVALVQRHLGPIFRAEQKSNLTLGESGLFSTCPQIMVKF